MKSLDPLTSRMTQLVDYILANLPFGIGQSIKITLKAINDLYQSLPPLATGVTAQVRMAYRTSHITHHLSRIT